MNWEYKTIKLATRGFLGGKLDEHELDSMMNALGDEGWELATVFDTNEVLGGTRDVAVLFKRPRE